MTPQQRLLKRTADIALASIALALTAPIIGCAILLARHDTGAHGIFAQARIGRHARPFTLYKIRTMSLGARRATESHVTVAGDTRITPIGAWLRRWKIDELPQLWNVLKGDMSLVGPRPDVPGFADRLAGEDRLILQLRPGITGPATLKYRHEEQLLATVDDPVTYNQDILWPNKVRINRAYFQDYRLWRDFLYLYRTIF